MEFLTKQNDYDDVDLSHGVVYEVEEKSDGKILTININYSYRI